MNVFSIYSSSVYFIIICFCGCAGSLDNNEQPSVSPVKVEIRYEDGKYSLMREDEPYKINGAGLEFGDIVKFKVHGGNSIRTWRTDNGQQSGQQVLDMALENGVTVIMCLEVERERHGFDYNNADEVEAQFQKLKTEVLKYKDHPALLMWAIGNELNLEYSNLKVYDAVNQLSLMIHEVDPNHPTTTTIAGINQELVNVIKGRASDIDVLSIQLYGDIVNLPKYIEETGWIGPYMVTEWGATGHWEVETTAWGAPIEQTSSIKANNYLNRYQTAIEPYTDQCIGSYVFLWGQKQERTPTWYGMFLESGEETESIDVMHYLWNGEWPRNRTPKVDVVKLNGQSGSESIRIDMNNQYSATSVVTDMDGDSIIYYWEIKAESTDLKEGGDAERIPESIPDLIDDPTLRKITFSAPNQEGAYRLFVYAFDGNNHAAHANLPFYVDD